MIDSIIEVRNLAKHFTLKGGLFGHKPIGIVKAVNELSFSVAPGETFAIVGESGCGKTTVANLLLKLL